MNALVLVTGLLSASLVSGNPLFFGSGLRVAPNREVTFMPIDPRVHYGNANLIVDMFLWRVNSKLPDTIPVPDINGAFHLTNCFVIGLENGIQRSGDATVVLVGDDAKFTSAFEIENLGMKCNWKRWPLHGTVTVTTAELEISTGFSLILKQGEHPWITEFRVTTFEPLTSDVTGVSPAFNWSVELIIDSTLQDLQDEMIYAIEHQVRDALQSILDGFIIP